MRIEERRKSWKFLKRVWFVGKIDRLDDRLGEFEFEIEWNKERAGAG